MPVSSNAASGGQAAESVPLPAPEAVRRPLVSSADAIKRMSSRLRDDRTLNAELVHHPMLGVEFRMSGNSRRRRPIEPRALLAHAVVDLVGGRAYVTEPWNRQDFFPRPDSAASDRDPQPRLARDTAIDAARELMLGVLFRRRRLGSDLDLHVNGEPLLFGKPNWWITAGADEKPVEVLVDAMTGKHFVFRA